MDSESEKQPVSFTVNLECEDSSSPKKIPQRFLQPRQRSQIEVEDLEKEQKQAEERRKKFQEDKIKRIKEKTEECMKIDQAVSKLLEQDAKRKGLSGTEKIKPMSSMEASTAIQTVQLGISKITQGLTQDINKAQS